MTGDRPNHQQPRTNKRKGKPDISLVLIKRVNLAFWLEGEGGEQHSPLGPPSDSGRESDSEGCSPSCSSHLLGSPPPFPLTPSLASSQHSSRTPLKAGVGGGVHGEVTSTTRSKPRQPEKEPQPKHHTMLK